MWNALTTAARRSPPEVAFVLGSGLGPVVERVRAEYRIGFADVPGLVPPTVPGHGGETILGEWAGRRVLVFSGRLHFYEGHSAERVAAPVRIAQQLGAGALVLTNASGGIRADLVPGTLMVLTDHLAWNRPNAWLATCQPSPYSVELRERLLRAAATARIELAQGTYAAVTGPSYETPAEIQVLRMAGADAVGMSTAHEAEMAAAIGLPVAAVSCVTNWAAGISASPLHHEDVKAVAGANARRLADLLEAFLRLFERPG